MSPNTTSNNLQTQAPTPDRGAQIRQQLQHFESLAEATSKFRAGLGSSNTSDSAAMAEEGEEHSSSPFARLRTSTVFTGDGRPSLKERWARIRSAYQSGRSTPSDPIVRPGTPMPFSPTAPLLSPAVSLLPPRSPSPLSLPPLSLSPPLSESLFPMTISISPPSPSSSSPEESPPRTPSPASAAVATPQMVPSTPPMDPIPEICPNAPKRASAVRRVSRGSRSSLKLGFPRPPSPFPSLPLFNTDGEIVTASVSSLENSPSPSHFLRVSASSPVIYDDDDDEDVSSELVGLVDEAADEWSSSPPAPASTPLSSRSASPSRSSSPVLDEVAELIKMVERAADDWAPSV